jgi:hypothetical protein
VTEVSPCSHLVSDACATINQARRLRWLRFSGPEPPQLAAYGVEPCNFAALRIEVRACKCVQSILLDTITVSLPILSVPSSGQGSGSRLGVKILCKTLWLSLKPLREDSSQRPNAQEGLDDRALLTDQAGE